jgi:molybdopterin synthase sulfur carrier subunit
MSTATKNVHVQYYALLREQRGAREETVATTAGSAEDLYAELRARHGFSLPSDRLRVVVNEEFRDWSAPVSEGDTVVFIPPVAGG